MKIIKNANELNESYLQEIIEEQAKEFNESITMRYDEDDDHHEWLVKDVFNSTEGVVVALANGSEIAITPLDMYGAKAVLVLEGRDEEDFLVAINEDDFDFEIEFSKKLLKKLRKFTDNLL